MCFAINPFSLSNFNASSTLNLGQVSGTSRHKLYPGKQIATILFDHYYLQDSSHVSISLPDFALLWAAADAEYVLALQQHAN